MHAELDLIKKFKPSGGKIYIAGRVSKSNNPMSNTQPCNYCVDAMRDCGITKVVYMIDGELVNGKI
jgi:hypothetical protein